MRFKEKFKHKRLTTDQMRHIKGGGCDVIYSFGGTESDFLDMLDAMEGNKKSAGQASLLRDLYNDGCISPNIQ